MCGDLKREFSFNFSNASVAVIDASSMGLEVITNVLAGYGFRKMFRSTDLSSGAEIIKSQPIDLLIVDPAGFGTDAYNLISWLRAEQSCPNGSAAVIIVTAHTKMRLITTARQCGADYIVAKPFSTSALLGRILWVATASERRGELMAPATLVNSEGSGVEVW